MRRITRRGSLFLDPPSLPPTVVSILAACFWGAAKVDLAGMHGGSVQVSRCECATKMEKGDRSNAGCIYLAGNGVVWTEGRTTDRVDEDRSIDSSILHFTISFYRFLLRFLLAAHHSRILPREFLFLRVGLTNYLCFSFS